MRITESQLRRIIREERRRLLEAGPQEMTGMAGYMTGGPRPSYVEDEDEGGDLERAGAALHAALEAYYSAAASAMGGHEAGLDAVQDFCEDFIVEYR